MSGLVYMENFGEGGTGTGYRWGTKGSPIFTEIKGGQPSLPGRKHCRHTDGEAKVEMEGLAWAASG